MVLQHWKVAVPLKIKSSLPILPWKLSVMPRNGSKIKNLWFSSIFTNISTLNSHTLVHFLKTLLVRLRSYWGILPTCSYSMKNGQNLFLTNKRPPETITLPVSVNSSEFILVLLVNWLLVTLILIFSKSHVLFFNWKKKDVSISSTKCAQVCVLQFTWSPFSNPLPVYLGSL